MVIMVCNGGIFCNTVVKLGNSIITNFQALYLIWCRASTNNQIITKTSMANNQNCFLNHINDWLTIGYWGIGDYLDIACLPRPRSGPGPVGRGFGDWNLRVQ